ncbi:hypothetical protein TWF106_008253 [Orbilia oligospora]|uniref:Uncharacterized protein n=1 Tax=Orbilia oligospora TaxID=2813651 RepID=A0A6G1MEL0_ORBOL|nr:hypothetical protein TWF788_005158 [Orbilia oligospora]KAF3216628.1 hypothetical protein TWF106_008253 [Orbilia oligospora]KAF3229160.1 hypothetical protein TWF191_001712 [Orbilia oligospora]KAF3255908.1 hypothetical protein TWF192_002341 [Orbilia oligospora]
MKEDEMWSLLGIKQMSKHSREISDDRKETCGHASDPALRNIGLKMECLGKSTGEFKHNPGLKTALGHPDPTDIGEGPFAFGPARFRELVQ